MIRRVDDYLWAARFHRAREPGPRAWLRNLGARAFGQDGRVDARQIARVLRAALRSSAMKDVDGLLARNYFRVFLHAEDFEFLRPLLTHIERRVLPALDAELVELDAAKVGRWSVCLAQSTEPVSRGHGLIRAEFMPDADMPPVVDGEITIRGPGPIPAPAPASAPAAVNPATPAPAPAAAPPGSVIVTWDGGAAWVAPGERRVFGWPHRASSEDFVPLEGMPRTEVEDAHFWVRRDDDGVVVGRSAHRMPLLVAGLDVPEGGDARVRLPATLAVGHAALPVRLEMK